MTDKQHTLKRSAKLSGIGLHTGKEVTIKFRPAPAGHGFKFQRIDLEGKPIIPANVDHVVDVSRGTTLSVNGAMVATVEHLLAALTGLQLDNVLIEVDGPEIPIMDGSAMPYIKAIKRAGILEQKEEREYFYIDENVWHSEPDQKVEIVAMPADEYQLTCMIDFESDALGSQHAHLDCIDDFKGQIADSRTFCFLRELEQLYDNNLIRGGDLNNAIVIVDHKVEKSELGRLRKMFNKKDIVAVPQGILNEMELRHQNEPARHKLLDVVGDLALVGKPIKGKIIASRPGHAANVEFARKLKKMYKQQRHKVHVPVYDPAAMPVADIQRIKSLLPHRYPFLLVDRIVEMTDEYVIGIKNVTGNEEFFNGHFPGNPIMPGVLQLEAMAQTGGILAMSRYEKPENYVTYFLRIEKARFKRPVVPGDVLLMKLELLGPIRRGICEMKATSYVGNQVATEAEMLAQIRKKPS